MLKIKEAIVVEGKYDKIRLSQIVDTLIIETSGFRVFNDCEKRTLLKKICDMRGIIILTDSDSAGFVIRNHLRGFLPKEKVHHAYIPQIQGKEKRKQTASKEGILGVEGINDEIIVESLKRAGATFYDLDVAASDSRKITKTDFYEDGLSGHKMSSKLRALVLKELGFPGYMSANALLEAMNILLSIEEYKNIVAKMKKILHFE